MLETKKVFIDTQCFVNAGLHFDGPAFKSFRKYCENDELIHISTSVVTREVKSKIENSVKDAINSIQSFRRKARLLSSLDDQNIKGLFKEIPDNHIHKKSKEVFEDFMTACSTEIIGAADIDTEELLTLYFDRKAPFGDGKKKSEFPDAISLLSLKSHLENEEKIYVISEDSDLKAYCEENPNFIQIESLDKLLDIYTTHNNARHEQVKQYFIDHKEEIKQKIIEILEGCDVYNSSSWEDAEVDEGLTVLSLGNIEPSILYINDEESQVTFDIEVEFEVTVTGPDFNNGTYDREDGIIYTFNKTSRTEAIRSTFTVEASLYYEFIDGKLEDAEDCDIDIAEIHRGIEVSIEENGNERY